MPSFGMRPRNHPQQTRYRGSSREVDDRALPAADFAKLDERFRFSIDVAASVENTKCHRFYTEAQDGLQLSWAGERVYCNPPYSDLMPWVQKAWREVEAPLVVLLLPANRTEQPWWQEQIEPFRDQAMSPLWTEFLPGRLRFLRPGQTTVGPNERPPFGIVLCVWERLKWN
jgi:phage N-6-adenine-methyltransferase